ncbi:thioredoxin family protein [Tenacibaculum agarivorans]|uniref:thioredoxin family protein n=1 Tax=Tenacibaculum agarivorans TaxID=1908389 RepID=UPI00094BB2D6|nr:thioredoxin family protein [Tenacibaculum agarivorans]
MKHFLSIICILFSLVSNAQEWHTDINQAKKIAKSENKNIVLVFQGGDWCIPCMKLDKEVWNTETFKTSAKEDFVMLLANFPRKNKNKLSAQQQEANAKLFERYNQEGFFPLVVIMNSEGKVLGKTGYKKLSAKKYIEHLQSFKS